MNFRPVRSGVEEMKMKTTGWALKEAIKLQELRSQTAAGAFQGALIKFPDEEKDAPEKIVDAYLQAEASLAKLQVAQKRYNLLVTCEVNGDKMTLEEVIKRVGGPARAEKFWRTAAAPKADRYGGYRNDLTRDPTQIVAKATVTTTEAMKLASVQAKRAGAFRAAIAMGNSREVEIEDLSPALFE
jgi:hypothetical protein